MNGKIKYEWLNLELDLFKIKCKLTVTRDKKILEKFDL